MKEYVRRMIFEKSELSARIEKAKKAVEHPPYGMTAEQTRMLSEQVKAMQVWVAVTGATLFYDTIFKSFEKLIGKIAGEKNGR